MSLVCIVLSERNQAHWLCSIRFLCYVLNQVTLENPSLGFQELGVGVTLKRLKEVFGDNGHIFTVVVGSPLPEFVWTFRNVQ